MDTKYLLPCSCGRRISILPVQAGQEIRCSCGTSLVAPTLLEMTALERAEPEGAPKAPLRSWGIRKGLVLLGIVITLAAVGLEIGLYLKRPVMATPDQIRRRVQTASPVASWNHWQALRAEGLNPVYVRRTDKQFADAVVRHRIWMGVVFVFAAGGITLIIVPILLARKEARLDGNDEGENALDQT